MNELQRTRVDNFGEDVWGVTEQLDRMASTVIAAAISSGDYSVKASPQVELDPEVILEETMPFPKVREFRHDTSVFDEELNIWMWATDEKKDIPFEEDGDIILKRFPNRFGGAQIGSTITLTFDRDGLVDHDVHFTITTFHVQGGSDERPH